MDVCSWAGCINLAAAKPGAAPLNKGFQLTAHLNGKVTNGLGFWETRLYDLRRAFAPGMYKEEGTLPAVS